MDDYQIIWHGITLDSSGYGRISREFVKGLDELGVDVKLIPLANQGARTVVLSPRLAELASKPIATNKKTIIINCIQPQQIDIEAQKEQFDYVVCNTVWETSVIPQVWKDSNIGSLDGIIVPCSQNVKALADSGVDTPIYIAPYGCDNEYFNPNNEPFNLDNDDRFTFLSVFEWGYRKAPDILLKAYWAEFTKDENVRLVIKTYAGDNTQTNRTLVDYLTRYKQMVGFGDSTAPLFVTTSRFEDEQIKSLYTIADTFVLVSRGEGFGMPYFEALNSEVPVISPKWGGGRADLLTDDYAYFVDHTLVQTKTSDETGIIREMHNLFTPDMQWAETDVDSLRQQMRYVFEHQDEAKNKGIAGRKALKHLTWHNASMGMKKAVEAIMRRKQQ